MSWWNQVAIEITNFGVAMFLGSYLVNKIIDRLGFDNKLDAIDKTVDSFIDKALVTSPKVDALYQKHKGKRTPPSPFNQELNYVKQDFANILPMFNKALDDFKVSFKEEILELIKQPLDEENTFGVTNDDMIIDE